MSVTSNNLKVSSASVFLFAHPANQSQEPLFADLFSLESLQLAYVNAIQPRGGRGIDRIGTDLFERRASQEMAIASRKALTGAYKFAPYSEQLITKGRGKIPRVISVPTLRDRLVLHQLKTFLQLVYPERVSRGLPNEYVRRIKASATMLDMSKSSFIRGDVEAFFDRVEHHPLLDQLRKCVTHVPAFTLLRRAVTNPTVPDRKHKEAHHTRRNRIGVPQGLAISNMLADIYMESFDDMAKASSLLYLRYVDDILLLAPTADILAVRQRVDTELGAINLRLNPDKTFDGQLTEKPFEYLGYYLQLPRVSVRTSTFEGFLQSELYRVL